MISETCTVESNSSPELAPAVRPNPFSYPFASNRATGSRLSFRSRVAYHQSKPARNAKYWTGIVGNGENRIIKGKASHRLTRVDAAHTQSGHGTWNPPSDCNAPSLLQPLHSSRVSG